MPKEETEKTEEKRKEGVTIKIPRMNPWMISTIILAIILVIVLVRGQGITGRFVTPTMSAQDAANKAIDYINKYLLRGQGTATLISVKEENGLYNAKLNIAGRQYDSYITMDGKLLFPSVVDMTQTPEIPEEQPQQQQEQPQQTTVDKEELAKFIGCLKNSDFKIYGANWCGWTKRLVTMLGGFDMVEPIYVECTEEQKICEEKGIRGYPTIFVGEEQYQGPRTFKAFSEATGCAIPPGAEVEQSNPPAGGCQ